MILIYYENSKQPSNPPHPNTDGAPGWLTQHALLGTLLLVGSRSRSKQSGGKKTKLD